MLSVCLYKLVCTKTPNNLTL